MTAASISEVLQHVHTPLALAALLLLLGAPLLREILRRRGRPNEDTKAIIRYGFILGLLFGVMAFCAFVYTIHANREIRISGIVLDESGAGLSSVSIRIAGRGEAVTNDHGSFEFNIPDSRAADHYDVEVYREDCIPQRITLSGRHPQPVTVTLRKTAFTGAVIKLPSQMTLRHNLGVPQVELGITFHNPYQKAIMLADIELTLVSPAGSPIPMLMEGMSVVPGQYGPALPIWKLDKGRSDTITYSFFNANLRFLELQQKIYAELAPKLYVVTGPDPNAKLLSDGLVKNLRDYMQAEFIWKAGTWEIRAACKIEGNSSVTTATFRLTDDDIKRMRAIADYYPAALGVMPAWRFWQSKDVNPTVSVFLNKNI